MPAPLHLRLLQITDLHTRVLSWDYLHDRPADRGLDRLTTLIDRARAEAANTLLFDNGDILQGTPLADAEGHPIIAALNAAGVDAGTIGNHDLDFGMNHLRAAVAAAAHPVASANLTGPTGPIFPPYAILQRTCRDAEGAAHDLRIGVLGLLPPQTAMWNAHHLAPHEMTGDLIDAARHWLPRLLAEAPDLIVVLCHSGLGDSTPTEGMEQAATALAALGGFDVLMAGHSHEVFPDGTTDRVSGIPTVQAGAEASHLGIIDLTLEHLSDGWRVAAAQSCAVAVTPDVPPAPRIVAAVSRAHAATRARLDEVIGETAVPLCSHFALLGWDRGAVLQADAMRAFAADNLSRAAEEIVVAVSPFRAGGGPGPQNFTDIPPGPLRARHIPDLYPYANEVRCIEVNGRMLRLWAEAGAQIYASGTDWLTREDMPSYNADRLLGLDYDIVVNAGDVSIRDLRQNGHPVDDKGDYVVVTNTYRASGAGAFGFLSASRDLGVPREGAQQILHRYVAASGPVVPDGQLPGRLVLNGATRLASAPGAGRSTDPPPGWRIETVERDPLGFDILRVGLENQDMGA